jgi:hypothetical protein
VLRALEEYPAWWPEVRTVRRLGTDRAAVVVRSILPYDLRFELVQDEVDRGLGVLRARLHGDLDGATAWSLTANAGGTTALRFDEDVTLTRSTLNRLAPVARRAFEWNHAVMMRHGERGLRGALGGYRVGRAARRDSS